MAPRSLTRWDLWARTFLHLSKKNNNCVSHFSTIQLRGKGLTKSGVSVQIRKSSNIVESPFPKVDIPNLLIPEIIWDTVDRHPDKTALKCGISGRRYSFGDIQKLSRRFMNSLIKAGFKKGDVIAVILPNCPEFGFVVLGALETDMAICFINHVYTPYEICHQLKDSGSVCVVSGVDQLTAVQAAITELEKSVGSKRIKQVIAMDFPPSQSLPEGVVRLSEMIGDDVEHTKRGPYQKRPNDLAFLPYSSGTTGLPKGVCLSHSNIVSNIFQLSKTGLEIQSPDIGQDLLLGLLPFYHIYGLVVILLHSLNKGGQVITLPKFEQKTLLRTFDEEKLSLLFLVPPLILFMGHSQDFKQEQLAHVRFIMSGAAPLGDTDMERLLLKIPAGNNCIVSQGYGMSELSPVATTPTIPVKNLATCGAPVPMTQGKVVCADTGKALGPNQLGELCFRGPQVMLGYHNNPKATADMIDVEGWLHTGDVGYYDEDSHFYIKDRVKELIKVKGFQVPPAELEAVLRTKPGVEDAGVIGVPDPKAGELPVAYIVRSKGTTLSEEKIKEFLAEKVAKHKQVARVIFVDSIPKSAAGKILRKDLRQMYKESIKQ